ncbi:hypothetical protein UPYG_G00078880 [Umbra pygmaea]|uniref:G-protein coupled receptors family 2 profile 1 domain-containing protein n=1 Tax=Umbra pygmaea TaxID=75934 RepID=A0ABD0XDC4_UMBPY
MRGIIFLSLSVLFAQANIVKHPFLNTDGFDMKMVNQLDTESKTTNASQFTTELPTTNQSQKIAVNEQICLERMNRDLPYNESGLYCNRIWDGWSCWNDTPAGTLGSQFCPNYPDFNTSAIVTRYCTDLGQWFVLPESNKEWSNYTLCHSGLR